MGPVIDRRPRGLAANGNAPIGSRHFAPLRRAVSPLPDVALVVEHRANGRVLPTDATVLRVNTRRRHAALVQQACDGRERATLEIQREDSPNDARLFFV